MQEMFERNEMLWGKTAQQKLNNTHIAVFGVGGVGGHALECLIRAGVGEITVVDNDVISASNLNRQILATTQNIGIPKVIAAQERALQINPKCKINALQMFYLPENASELAVSDFDYIIDAIDTVSAKIELVIRAQKNNVPIISAMGCGNKLNPTAFFVTDLFETSGDALARVLRRELRKKGVKTLKVVCSSEPAIKPHTLWQSEDVNCETSIKQLTNEMKQAQEPQHENETNCSTSSASCNSSAAAKPHNNKPIPASVSFVPGACGMIMAGRAIKDILKLN